jgi:hypothetical protein
LHGIGPLGADGDRLSLLDSERQYAQDALGVRLSIPMGNYDIAFKWPGSLNEQRGGPGVQADFAVHPQCYFWHRRMSLFV